MSKNLECQGEMLVAWPQCRELQFAFNQIKSLHWPILLTSNPQVGFTWRQTQTAQRGNTSGLVTS